MILPAGTRAPAFTLKVTPDQMLSLADFSGRPVVLAFYPADWSPVCGDQMVYNEVRPMFQKHGAEVLGSSVGLRASAKHQISAAVRFSSPGEIAKNTAPIASRRASPIARSL